MATITIDDKIKERLARRKEIEKRIYLIQNKMKKFELHKQVTKKPETVAYCEQKIALCKELKAKLERALRAA